jgi:hypothetical protein
MGYPESLWCVEEGGRLLPQTIPHPIAMRLRKDGAPGLVALRCGAPGSILLTSGFKVEVNVCNGDYG